MYLIETFKKTKQVGHSSMMGANIRSVMKALRAAWDDDTLYYEKDAMTKGMYLAFSKKYPELWFRITKWN